MEVSLQRFPDGTLIDWGRNWRGMTVSGKKLDGYGGARYYAGEAAEVMNLVLKYQKEHV